HAFTHGNHIWLGPAQSSSDVRLMSHEAAHVVQQGAAPGKAPSLQRREADHPAQHSVAVVDLPAPGSERNAGSDVMNTMLEELPDHRKKPAGDKAAAPATDQHGRPDPKEVSRKKQDLHRKGDPHAAKANQHQPQLQKAAHAAKAESQKPPSKDAKH